MKTVAHYTTATVRPAQDGVPAYNETRYTSPDRTEVTDGSGNWLATFTDGSYSVLLKGPTRTFQESQQPIADTFNRTRTGDWGVLSSGGSWSESGANSTTFNVGSNTGTMVVSNVTGTASRATTITHALQDVDAKVRVSVDKSAAGGAITAGIITGYQDTNNHYYSRVELKPSASTISDAFTRTASSGWGTAESGQAWSTVGTATDYSCNGSVGMHTVGSINVSRRSLIGSGTDLDAVTRVSTDALASGASLFGGIIGRYQDSNNHYIFRVRFSPSQVVQAAIQKQVAGVNSTIGSEATVSGLTHAANTFFWVRAQAVGSTLQMRVWLDGQPEPATWDVSVTDTTFTGVGSAGVRSIVGTGSTNTLPVTFSYDDFSCIFDNGGSGDPVYIRLYKQVADVTSSISSDINTGLFYSAATGEKLWIRTTMSGGVLNAKVWKDGSSEPGSWQVSANDITFTTGRVGVRAYLNTTVINAPITYTWSDFSATATWTTPPVVVHDKWLRFLSSPFAGTIDYAWLTAKLRSVEPDALEYCMQYVANALPLSDGGGMQFAGDSSYGPLEPDGSRQEGADFNDYLGITWGADAPEAGQFRCLDCSGFVRMAYGYRSGLDLSLLPRNARGLAASGPGVIIVPDTGVAPDATGLAKMQIGDAVFFDADTAPPEPAGQIDHAGIYLGVDTVGKMRFISSRKSTDGPTFCDSGGASVIGSGTGTYASSFRIVRRF